MAEKCKECGCICAQCRKNDEEDHTEMHLHVEIEHLRQRLLERDSHIVTMETQFLNEADKFPNGELASIKEEMLTWQEKYSRLYEAHKRVQKVNQNLEDKLLRIVDKCETEKSAFTKDIATLSHRLADANYTIHRLTQDNEKYRNDVNLAIQLLQCKPSNFVSQRYDSLPSEVQAKVRTYVAQKRGVPNSDGVAPLDVKSITVPISTFPPTAMVYNITKSNNFDKDSDDESDDSKPPVDIVSAAIMAKVLEERERERVFAKHCDTCTCHRSILTNEVETQTDNYLSNSYNNGDKFTDNSNSTIGLGGKNLLALKPEEKWSDLNANSNSLKPSGGTSLQFVNEKPIVSRNMDQKSDNVKLNRLENKNGNYALISDALHQQQLGKENSNKKGINQSPIKQATFNHGNSMEKNTSRQSISRGAKKSEPQSIYRITKTSGQSAKYKQLPSTDLDFVERKSQRQQIDVINDRIWKNDWSISGQKKPIARPQETPEEKIDVINDRTWKSENTNTTKPRLTLIEVKPLAVDSTASNLLNNQQNDSRLHQSEDTASPSFSSDSLVISSSDPPSTSSDAISQLGNNRTNKTSVNNMNNSLMSNWQDRTTGPRGCSMRITPGSKNILLDNAGNYQTVLYTSTAGGKPSTALVHTAKSNKSGGGSTSNSSNEDNSPAVLPTDNTQLQRVAEWIKASGPIERQNSNKSNDDLSIKTLSNALSKIKDGKLLTTGHNKKSNFVDSVGNSKGGNSLNGKQTPQYLPLKSDRSKKDGKFPGSRIFSKDETEDLISFDSPVDDRENNEIDFSEQRNKTKIIDVKVTREMEETYLKLAASLDPDNLELSSSESNDITIEKYRREFKRTQSLKHQDKTS